MSTRTTGRWNPSRETLLVVRQPRHTRNLFGPVSAIAGQELEIYEPGRAGGYLCCVHGRYFVDVDPRDVAAVLPPEGWDSREKGRE